MKARVRAVIVRWRGGDEIRRCLRSLLDSAGGLLAHVVLVDSGSADGGAERLASEFPEIEVMALAENRGFAFAAGCGAGEGTEPFLLLLNPDIAVQAGAVDALVDLLDSRPGTAGVVPLLTGLDGESQHRWQLRHLPKTRNLIFLLFTLPVWILRFTFWKYITHLFKVLLAFKCIFDCEHHILNTHLP